MKDKELFNAKLNEFKSKIIKSNDRKNTASILLYKDYLSKLYEWYKFLNIEEHWKQNIYKIYKAREGHNLIYLTNPSLLNDFIDIEDFRDNYLKDVEFDTSKYRGFEYIYIYIYIYWQIFKSYPEFSQYRSLPDPYESAIKILERGNHIYFGEMSTIEVDHDAINENLNFRLPSLDNGYLDYIDNNCNRIGTLGIPNQEEVNILWQEFQKIL